VVSAANVGQLAADLLIASLALERIGAFDPSDLVPVVGGRESGEEGITTPLERTCRLRCNDASLELRRHTVYGKKDLALVVVQQRSPALKVSLLWLFLARSLTGIMIVAKRAVHVVSPLLPLLLWFRWRALYVRGGLYRPLGRTDAVSLLSHTARVFLTSHHRAPIYHLLPPSSPPLANTPLSELGQLPIPAFVPFSSTYGLNAHSKPATDKVPIVPGGGLTRRLLSSLPSPFPPTVALLQFVMEGDNREDAKLLATAVARILGESVLAKLPPAGWQEPGSWKMGLFGTEADSTLYG
jgi:proteasome assembly chaperone 2